MRKYVSQSTSTSIKDNALNYLDNLLVDLDTNNIYVSLLNKAISKKNYKEQAYLRIYGLIYNRSNENKALDIIVNNKVFFTKCKENFDFVSKEADKHLKSLSEELKTEEYSTKEEFKLCGYPEFIYSLYHKEHK